MPTPQQASHGAAGLAPDGAIVQLAPRPGSRQLRIDYGAWDDMLDYIVFRMGRSMRQFPGIARPGMGTRIIRGHQSAYRLEGNRVTFSFFTPELIETIGDYRRELEQLAGQLDIATLGRNEQLAYWINLHNVAVIEQVARAWPIRQPREIRIDGKPLDEAPFIEVAGLALSPRDIRERIVYPHWKDPRVIYGFFRGEIGGPSIQSSAYDGTNVARLLDRNAREFVNSLRGVQKSGDRLLVSSIYAEARPFYFAQWPEALRAHLAAYADEEVREILAETGSVEATVYEHDIADMAGGTRESSFSLVTSDGRAQSFRVPQGMQRLLREYAERTERLMRKGVRGRVYFEDINLPGETDMNTGEIE